MCKFFSAISDGNGKVKFFKLEDVVNQMAEGNPKSFDWNSHTSIATFYGITPLIEDKWNKWEYDVDKKEIKADSLVGLDDRDLVVKAIKKYLKGKDLGYIRNLYNRNSGNYNSGNRNSGYRNSGYYNSGNHNSGYCNSGNHNSGNYNSGDHNSGNYNSGNCNSGSLVGHFCADKKYFLFDMPCTKEEAEEVGRLNLYNYFDINIFVYENKMTAKEKKANPNYKILGGYLKTIDYKQAWKKVPKEVISKIKKLKNFDKKKFFEITGRN